VGAYKCVSAVSEEIVGGTLPEKRLSKRTLRHNVAVRKRDSARGPHGGDGAYRWSSLVSAVMLAGIGPVKPFLDKSLSTGAHAGRTSEADHTRREPLAQRSGGTTAGTACGRTGA
jgi:hypothetical protein